MTLRKAYRAYIAREYRDSDGYWIELVPGYQNGLDPGTHGIVETHKRDAYDALSSVIPCDCAECTRLKSGIPRDKDEAL